MGTGQPVVAGVARCVPVAAALGGMAMGVAILIGIPVGVLAAVRPDGLLDFFARSVAILGLSIPAFVTAILVTLLPAIWWGWTPRTRFVEWSPHPAAYVLQFVLPPIILAIRSAAGILRLTP